MNRIKVFFGSFVILVVTPTLISLWFAYFMNILPYQKNEHTKIYYVYINDNDNDDGEYLLGYDQSQGEKCLTFNGVNLVLIGKRYGSLGFGVSYKNKIEDCR